MNKKKLNFKIITAESPEKAGAETIYNEAFPERERSYSFDELLRIAEESGIFKMGIVFSDKEIIGIVYYAELDGYVYLTYFAMNSALRGGGYGSRLIRAFQDAFEGKPVICGIETPIPGTSNYGQREKRRRFYERNGMHMTEYSYGRDAENRITVVSNRSGDEIAAPLRDVIKVLLRWMPRGYLEGIHVYITENGKVEEFRLSVEDMKS